MQVAATAFHEMFKTLQFVGFTEKQAIELVAVLIERTGTTGSTDG